MRLPRSLRRRQRARRVGRRLSAVISQVGRVPASLPASPTWEPVSDGLVAASPARRVRRSFFAPTAASRRGVGGEGGPGSPPARAATPPQERIVRLPAVTGAVPPRGSRAGATARRAGDVPVERVPPRSTGPQSLSRGRASADVAVGVEDKGSTSVSVESGRGESSSAPTGLIHRLIPVVGRCWWPRTPDSVDATTPRPPLGQERPGRQSTTGDTSGKPLPERVVVLWRQHGTVR